MPCSLGLQSLSVSTTKLPLTLSLNPWGLGIEGPPNKWDESHSFLQMSPISRRPQASFPASSPLLVVPLPLPPASAVWFEAHVSVRGRGDIAAIAPSAAWTILVGLRPWGDCRCFRCPPRPAPGPCTLAHRLTALEHDKPLFKQFCKSVICASVVRVQQLHLSLLLI